MKASATSVPWIEQRLRGYMQSIKITEIKGLKRLQVFDANELSPPKSTETFLAQSKYI